MERRSPENEDPKCAGEGLDKLLSLIDTERERAAEKYQHLQNKLIRFFEWKGCWNSQDLADETTDRVIKKIGEGEEIRDLSNYCYGVARNVWKESLEKARRERSALENVSHWVPSSEDPEQARMREQSIRESEKRLECLQQCLETVAQGSRKLILGYYQQEKGAKIENRKEIANQLGIPLNALRIRAYRIRETLETCVRDCIAQSETTPKYIRGSATGKERGTQ